MWDPRHIHRAGAVMAAAVAALGCWIAAAQGAGDSVADFYHGKTMNLIISSSPGGGYDTMGRLLARHLGEFIPGHPTIVAQNMPGGGGIVAANNIYNSDKQDGSVIGLVQRGVMIAQMTKQHGAQFDVSKINWIGSVASEISVAVSWHTSPIKTLQDLLHHELVVGGSGATSDTEASARLLNALVGTKFRIVSGYPGLNDVVLAMERGEVQGLADWSWEQLETRDNHYIKDHLVNVLIQNSLHKAADLPNVPLAMDEIKKPADRRVAQIYFAMKEVARPVMFGPGVPKDRVEAVRKAFLEMGKDPAFLADSKKTQIPVDPVGAKPVEDFIKLATSAPADVQQRLTAILNPSGATNKKKQKK